MAQSVQLVLSEKNVKGLYKVLSDYYGLQGWWPLRSRRIDSGANINYTLGFNSGGYHPGIQHETAGDDIFEIAVGAVLTQNTTWSNAAAALDNLISVGILSMEKIIQIDVSELSQLIKSSGYYNQKAVKLKIVAALLLEKSGSELTRSDLLSVRGIGPETADSIMLYALNKPYLVIDAYTRRILSRFFGDEKINNVGYETLREAMEAAFYSDTHSLKEYHALFVIHAKKYCSKIAKCSGCPVGRLCKKNKMIASGRNIY